MDGQTWELSQAYDKANSYRIFFKGKHFQDEEKLAAVFQLVYSLVFITISVVIYI